MKYKLNIITVFILLVFASCSQRGNIIECNENNSFSEQNIVKIIQDYQLTDIVEYKYPVKELRIIYQTINKDNKIENVSGFLYIPENAHGEIQLFSFQHATVLQKDFVNAGLIAKQIAVAVATEGNVCCVPDYLGLGVSKNLHPYLNAKLSASVVIDNIKAVKKYCSQNKIMLNEGVFMAGFSEGGYVTLAAQKEIEENYSGEISLIASAPMSGPYDLESTFQYYLNEEKFVSPSIIAYVLESYNMLYDFYPDSNIYKHPYDSIIPLMYSGDSCIFNIEPQLPRDRNTLLSDKFVNDFVNGKLNKFENAIAKNTIIDWKPKTPTLLIHGNADKLVPYSNSTNAFESFKNNGSTSVQLKTIENGDHFFTAFMAYKEALIWFKNFRQ